MTHLTDWTIGIDLDDKKSFVYAMNRSTGEIVEDEVAMTESSLQKFFAPWPRCLVVFEVGGHSRWVKRVIETMGFDVLVADPRRIALITKNTRKNDRNDAMRLAGLASADLASTRLEVLNPVEHRNDDLQSDLAILKSRDTLVGMRTNLITMIRGVVKTTGQGRATSKKFRYSMRENFTRYRTLALLVATAAVVNGSIATPKNQGSC